MRTALTIAGSDSSGGAGIQADLKTFAALGVYGQSAITAVTAQNTTGVQAVMALPVPLVVAQVDAAFDDIGADAVKIGMLASAAIIEAVAGILRRRRPPHVVVDPVMVAKGGAPLLPDAAVDALRRELLPLADVVTPNVPEAAAILARDVATLADLRDAARRLADLGARAVLVKGGHLSGKAVDVLWDGRELREFHAPRIDSRQTHGTGCTLSSAIAAGLARGLALPDAVDLAKTFVTSAIGRAPGLGRGQGPLGHFPSLY
jgi:hydroxymethylpyrimidine/phosphomethylpyrimidine kinase